MLGLSTMILSRNIFHHMSPTILWRQLDHMQPSSFQDVELSIYLVWLMNGSNLSRWSYIGYISFIRICADIRFLLLGLLRVYPKMLK